MLATRSAARRRLAAVGTLAATSLLLTGLGAAPAHAVSVTDPACSTFDTTFHMWSAARVGASLEAAVVDATAMTTVPLTVTATCPNQEDILPRSVRVTLVDKDRRTASVQADVSAVTAVTPQAQANGTFTASWAVQVPLDSLGAGPHWVSNVSAALIRSASPKYSANNGTAYFNGATPWALPAAAAPRIDTGVGSQAGATPELPPTSAPGAPIEVRMGAWSPDAVLSYEWEDQTGTVRATTPSWTPPDDVTSATLAVTGTWPDGAQQVRTSARTTLSVPGGFMSYSIAGRLAPYGSGFTVRRTFSDGTVDGTVAFPNSTSVAWYPVADDGTVLGLGATSGVRYAGYWTPAPTDVGQRFVLTPVTPAPGKPPTAYLGPVTVLPAFTPKLYDAGYTSAQGASAAEFAKTAHRSGAALKLTNPWPVGVPVSYAWIRDGKTTVSASATYTPTAADVGHRLQGVTRTTSPAFAVKEIKAGAFTVSPALIAVPQLILNRSTARVGDLLSVKRSGGTAGVTAKYQWLRNSKAIKGATGMSYRLAPADYGQRVGVRITASKTGYTTGSRDKGLSKDTAAGLIKPGTLKVSGTARVGYTLKAVRGGTRTAGSTATYSWYRNGKLIWLRGSHASYKLTAADRGKRVEVVAFVSAKGYTYAQLRARMASLVK